MNGRIKFSLTSDQLELLVAFEQCGGLTKLAAFMAKDPSVISRNLQRLAEDASVITKVDGRWQLSALGRQISSKTVSFCEDLNRALASPEERAEQTLSLAHAALVIINAQVALSSKSLGNRSNADAEVNLMKLIGRFRNLGRPIIHVRHISQSPTSLFYRSSPSAGFMEGLGPEKDEVVLDKQKSSAFADTALLNALNERDIDTVIIAGFTANECIDATARQAGDFGFTSVVVGDATATFDIYGPDGKLHLAERIHALTLANLHNHFAVVVNTADLMA